MSSATNTQSRSERTRAKILTTAEQLFARHGVSGVSLNTITQAAQQKNKNAIHYHFGGKDGLLQAIFDKHRPRIIARRNRMLDEIEQSGSIELVDLVKALVIPAAEKLDDPDGGEEYLHISAELIATNTLTFYLAGSSQNWLKQSGRLEAMIHQTIDLSLALLQQRMLLVVSLLFHGLSDHARIRAIQNEPSLLTDTDLLLSNLIDTICAALSGGASRETLALLEQRQ